MERRLADFPDLHRWYGQLQGEAPPIDEPSKRLLWVTCRCLSSHGADRLRIWMSGMREFFAIGANAYEEFLDVEESLATKGLDFLSLASDIAELAIRSGHGSDYFTLMQRGADRTSLAAFRFLAAWTALNDDNLELCIAECEKIDQPFACVHTLHGQALLESGQAEEAVEVLKIAVELDPKEILANFQLARACYAGGLKLEAWQAICKTYELQPGHPEIVVFAVFAAIESADQDVITRCASMLKASLSGLNPIADPEFYLRCIEVYIETKDAAGLSSLLAHGDWQELRRNPQMIQNTAWILRTLDERKWAPQASQFLRLMTEDVVDH